MKIKFMHAAITLAIIISCQTAICQNCNLGDGCANPLPIFMSKEKSKEFIEYYDSLYRSGGDRDRFKKHSTSVDFSKTAFKEFYEAYGGTSTQYDGVAFNFISFNNYNRREGQVHTNQISLVLSPATCKGAIITPEPTNYMIRNNSYNMTPEYFTNNQDVFMVKSGQLETFVTRYEKNYRTSDDTKNKYSRFLFLHKDVITAIKDFLTDHDKDYASIRVFFASYNENVVCRQADKTQITLLIAPVKESGEADFSVWNDPSAWKQESWNKLKDFNTINHGALCPNNCN